MKDWLLQSLAAGLVHDALTAAAIVLAVALGLSMGAR